jgi:hypothetical protein
MKSPFLSAKHEIGDDHNSTGNPFRPAFLTHFPFWFDQPHFSQGEITVFSGEVTVFTG